jgi:DNA replication licensing factor MCM4
MPASSAPPPLSAPAAPSDEPDEIRAIWGTTVNLSETMKLFRDFLRGFKPKYRAAYNREHGLRAMGIAPQADGEAVLYEGYLRRMRQTGETNLNLDVVNLLAYPPCRKLHGQLIKYPQEVVPAMDQVLKDLMLEIAELDAEDGREGMLGEEGEAEISEIMGKVYKVRPFGMKAVNMRELNPTGNSPFTIYVRRSQSAYRYRQARVYQRSRHPRDARHSGHEGCLLSLPSLFAHRAGRD